MTTPQDPFRPPRERPPYPPGSAGQGYGYGQPPRYPQWGPAAAGLGIDPPPAPDPWPDTETGFTDPPGRGNHRHRAPSPPRRRPVFPWVLLAVQTGYLAALIAGTTPVSRLIVAWTVTDLAVTGAYALWRRTAR